ncbi:hypothetical protein [Bradyrhizobium sp. DOA1]|uniref:hypothetical protein n=1 Tax=Bradyrhizobium sp. DOA1 TaxID=1126616 RepID=UPI000AA03156|nr:hypothetical protein [Bradyrhizobium sp. DOA1]
MTVLPQLHIRLSHSVKRPDRLASSFLASRFGGKLSLSRRVLIVAARLRRVTNEAIAAAIAEHVKVALSEQQRPAENSQLFGRSTPYSPLDQLIAWAAARLDSNRRV